MSNGVGGLIGAFRDVGSGVLGGVTAGLVGVEPTKAMLQKLMGKQPGDDEVRYTTGSLQGYIAKTVSDKGGGQIIEDLRPIACFAGKRDKVIGQMNANSGIYVDQEGRYKAYIRGKELMETVLVWTIVFLCLTILLPSIFGFMGVKANGWLQTALAVVAGYLMFNLIIWPRASIGLSPIEQLFGGGGRKFNGVPGPSLIDIGRAMFYERESIRIEDELKESDEYKQWKDYFGNSPFVGRSPPKGTKGSQMQHIRSRRRR